MSWKDNLKNPHSGGGFFCTLLIGRLSIQSLVTLLVLLLGWTPLALILQGNKNEQGAANIPAILVHFNMMASQHCCSRFVGCISMMWVSHSITFKKKCSNGSGTGNSGGQVKNPVLDYFSFLAWYVLLLEAARRCVHCADRRRIWCLNYADLVLN